MIIRGRMRKSILTRLVDVPLVLLCYLTLDIASSSSVHISALQTSSTSDLVTISSTTAMERPSSTILMLDIDNTLYAESIHRIEAQIAQNIHQYVANELSLLLDTATKLADTLHLQYGSTIEGLRQTVWKKFSKIKVQQRQRDFYEKVYRGIDYRSLLVPNIEPHTDQSTMQLEDDTNTETSLEEPDNELSITPTTSKIADLHPCAKTGYMHTTNQAGSNNVAALQSKVRQLLLQIVPTNELHLASNSPTVHVQTVIQAMGLASVPWKGLWTPDKAIFVDHYNQNNNTNKNRVNEYTTRSSTAFPTKLLPHDFWGLDFLKQYGKNITLIDDSATTMASINKNTNFRKILLYPASNAEQAVAIFPYTLPQALAVALRWISDTVEYKFDDVQYLRSKNSIDQASLHADTWMRMIQELTAVLCLQSPSPVLQIVDIGAGILPMLKWILQGSSDHGRNEKPRLPSVLASLRQKGVAVEEVHYYAYEPNRRLEAECRNLLQSLGFTLQVKTRESIDKVELVFVRRAKQQQPQCTVYLRFWDFQDESLEMRGVSEQPTPHLIVGCCFADLLEPRRLIASLLRCFMASPPTEAIVPSTLIYFPITFSGVTQFLPPQPFEDNEIGGRPIPSDTTALSAYSQSLTNEHGHYLDPRRLEAAITDYGGTCLGRGSSDWIIEASIRNEYLWHTMFYFFGNVAAPALHIVGWDAQAWLNRTFQRRPTIRASNLDFLFRLPHLGGWNLTSAILKNSCDQQNQNGTLHTIFEQIIFTGPRQVTTVLKNITRQLAPDEICIRTECSLISSGTELKIFTGSFDDAMVDVNIAAFDKARMTYPLAYGYSLVGRVVECGKSVPTHILGKRVFAFAPHASQVITPVKSIQLVPEGCDALDAIFLPSVETALSLVQDARPIVGEEIAIYGQGLIGLLVTSILANKVLAPSLSGRFGTITTFDAIPERLAASAAMGASQALLPADETFKKKDFDVAIEVSGNGRALQTAIDQLRDGGRLVIGSWYGNTDVSLRLGIDFHRSQKSLHVSQVSEIPSILSKTWSKERRFALAWELLQVIRPSRLLTLRTQLQNAQRAYESLENGTNIAVAFEYNGFEC